ncbi:Zn(II)2Cys6 transcription factor [Aspergillus clavatus NRRL 1]|uniref:C6 transcription factor, putative n=1 Tax=Aspergillus clavatus (strain ATCC 1007 / CBS 513.65 / DSM 816 / NCTC 3887 / NRRL 1 / QM 1276 / 107) TaxID=344612 RepID=A1CKB8_ASPCL|nr:C6 transcription factor, putative [Aspergillus clavatus NRRL 1]EAW09592.1 C6 transcription factor, putative [Aspergillus clavatus NRRL 1]
MENPSSTVPESGNTNNMRGQLPLQQFQQPNGNGDNNSTSTSTILPNKPAFVPSNSNSNSNSSSAGTSRSGTREGANAKVAIPRQRSTVAPRYSRRVPRACETCRARKTKCSGDTPVCRQCKELRVSCQYPVSWRERTKGQLDILSIKTHDYENLLREIGNVVDSRVSERIKSVLDKYAVENSTESSSNDPQSSVTPRDEEMDQDEPPSSPSSIGSLDAIDRVEEDLNLTESSRATGYMGKNSELTWMQRLQRESEQRVRKRPGALESEPEGEFALHTVNYHLDDMDITIPGPVQVYWMPPRHVADQLFEDYLATIHPFYPIISRTLFRAQYKTFFESAARPGDKWLAILNMIFAIASKHAHLTQAPWRGDERDHLVYLTRARILSMNGDTLFNHPDLQQVQVEGLIAFYLLASDQINRAWRIASLAVRSAISLGINMKNTSATTPNISKEARYRVWWCLYTFEHMLGIMTGRSTCILDGVCTTPMPLPFEEDQLREPFPAKLLADPDLRQAYVGSALASSYVRQMPLNPPGGKHAQHTDKPRDARWLKSQPASQALGFLFYTDLAVITQEIVNRVYSPDVVMTPWAHIENRIGELRARIDRWYLNLPEVFDFSRQTDDQDEEALRLKLFLAFHYHSARITLGRPCLCRRDARPRDPSKKPAFSHTMAEVSLDSARQMLQLIPDQPNAIRLYQICPWWCILHYMMQAATILLIELSFGSIHMPEEEQNFLAAAKKAIRWLYAMSECSAASRRAWQLCDSNLRRIAVGMNYDVSDMPQFVYENKPDQPINMHRHDSHPQTTNIASTPMFYNATDDSGLVNATNHSQEAYQYYPNQQPAFPGPQGMPTLDLLSAGSSNNSGDAYFPYDPISGEFIRSFFPASTEEEPWTQ